MKDGGQSRIRDFVRDIKNSLGHYRSCTVTRHFIQETFYDPITHDPNYFPLPGDPEPSDVFTDFQRCMEQNGLSSDGRSSPIITIRSLRA